MMVNFNNYTTFGIHNKVERYSWAAYHLFVFLSSLIGDTLILYASFQRDVFKLNKFIVTVIQHIAVSDLLFAIYGALPGTISLLANKWVLGKVMCYVRVYVGYLCYPQGLWLMAVLTTSKFLLLQFPIRCGNLTKRMAHILCALTLIPSSITPIAFLIVKKDDIWFDYKYYTCEYHFAEPIWLKLGVVLSIIRLFVPIIVIVTATIPTLKYLADARRSARRVQGNVPRRGTLTVSFTAVVCCLSALPTIVKRLDEKKFQNCTAFLRTAKFALIMNIMSNFYIYTLTIKSFRRFLLSKITSVLSVTRNTTYIIGKK